MNDLGIYVRVFLTVERNRILYGSVLSLFFEQQKIADETAHSEVNSRDNVFKEILFC